MKKRLITLTVNGDRHEIAVSPKQTLNQVIRDELRLTGTKRGCTSGSCGVCTVNDEEGRAILSCISLAVECETQQEIDKYYDALLQGGTAEPCGWIKDKYGVSWQVRPIQLGDMMASPEREKAKHAMEAMLKMTKLDLPALQKAFEGQPAGARN